MPTNHGDYVWHGHHENSCPIEQLTGTLENRRVQIKESKPHAEHAIRIRLLRPCSPQAILLFKQYEAAKAMLLQPILALHATECGCTEWNGKEIVFA